MYPSIPRPVRRRTKTLDERAEETKPTLMVCVMRQWGSKPGAWLPFLFIFIRLTFELSKAVKRRVFFLSMETRLTNDKKRI